MKRAFFALVLFGMASTPSVLAATIVVTTTADTIAGDGHCSLREAIIAANTNLPSGECIAGEGSPTVDSIVFDIPGAGTQTISVASDLPVIVGNVVIDGGNSGVASNRVELTGGGSVSTGLNVSGVSSGAIRNLVINGFTSKQIQLFGVTGFAIEGNYLGLNAAGTAAVANSGNGIELCCGSTGILIGGTTAAARNVISGVNNSTGILVAASGITIQGNYIGLDATGTTGVGGLFTGITINNGSATIGGLASGTGNVIATHRGIFVTGNPALGHSSGLIQGNYVGTDATGTAAINLGTVFGNEVGIGIDHGANVVISGGNVISGGSGDGVTISSSGVSGASSFDNTIQGNFIGTAADGVSPLGNSRKGIDIFISNGNRIGGENPGEGNVIAFNGQNGVRIGAGTGDTILRNSIHSNGALGIALSGSGTTPITNNAGDGDGGSNNQQNFPDFSTGAFQGSNIVVSGSLDSNANTTYRVEFFANGACDASGNGEGRAFLGAADLTTSAGGTATFNSLSFPATGGPVITATATVKTGPSTFTDTSEFSRCFLVATLDIDGDGTYDPLLDALVVLRYLFGLSGSAVTDGIVFPAAAQRKTPAAIQQYLDYIKPALDVDGNSQMDALTDGMMIFRYMLGLRGDALVANVIGQNPTRNTGQIEAFISSLMPM